MTLAERSCRLSSDALAIVLPGGVEAAVEARSAVGMLRRPIGPKLLPVVELLVTELVTNSVRHADAGPDDPVRLAVAVSDEAIHVEVSDLGPGFSPTRLPPPSTDGTGGWGLVILDRCATRWGTRHAGRCVWFELERNGGSPSPEAPIPPAAST